MSDPEAFVISRLVWFGAPCGWGPYHTPRERYAAEVQPVSTSAQITQQGGPGKFRKRRTMRCDEQIESRLAQLSDQISLADNRDREIGERLLQSLECEVETLN